MGVELAVSQHSEKGCGERWGLVRNVLTRTDGRDAAARGVEGDSAGAE